MRVQLIRHATLLVSIKGIRFLVDPMLSAAGTLDPSPGTVPQNKNPLVELPQCVRLETFQSVDAVLLTHTHRDHWDDTAIRLLPPTMPIFCQPEDSLKIIDDGFKNVTPVNDTLTWNGIELTRTSAKHGVGEMADKMGPVSGFVLEAENEPTLYITGDTVWCDEVREAYDQKRPDVIVAFAGAAAFTSGGPITMTAEHIRRLCEIAPKSRIMAVHLEAWNHCSLLRRDLRSYIHDTGMGEQLVIPNDGETIEFRCAEFAEL